MFNKMLMCFLFLMLTNMSFGAENTLRPIPENKVLKSIEISLEKNAENQNIYEDLLAKTLYREAITLGLREKSLDETAILNFWQKIKDKNLDLKSEVQLLKPLFSKEVLPAVLVVKADSKSPVLPRSFSYELNPVKLQEFIDATLLGYDQSLKTLYILSDITIAKDMSWADLGVSNAENFTGVILESWKKWAIPLFKKFNQVVILEKDLASNPSAMNSESVTLKWNSSLKKAETFQDRQSARFEILAQYVLVNTKSNQIIMGFDFPSQKKEVGISNPKNLSSSLASLIYNLLASQGNKIVISLDQTAAGLPTVVSEFKLVGKHGLFDLTLVNNFLNDKFKDAQMNSQVKSYDPSGSTLTIKSSLNSEALVSQLISEGGKFPLNEQKILVFSPVDRTFAIISK